MPKLAYCIFFNIDKLDHEVEDLITKRFDDVDLCS